MIFTKKTLINIIRDAIYFEDEKKEVSLKSEVIKLKDEVAELKLQKKLEEKEIKHLVKMKQEKDQLELDKKLVVMQRDYQEKERELERQYHEKQMELIKEGKVELKAVYDKLSEALPNVNMKITEKR